jgi:anti-sigma factor RsiW
MVCKIARLRFFEYLDQELPEGQRSALESHLTTCRDCQRLMDAERGFRELYTAPLRPDPVPQHVRDHIARLLDALPDDQAAAPRSPWTLRRSLVAALALFALGTLLGAGVGGLFGAERGWHRGNAPLMRLADASVEQHQKLARGILPHDIQHVAPKAAEQWFKARLNFNVSLPELTGEDLTLVGGRVSNLRDLEVAALHYQVEGKDVSLFIIPLERYQSLGITESPKFKMITQRGYDVIVWASHGAAYTLVSEIGGRSCLVCHSPKEKLDLPAGSQAHDKL